MSDPISYKELEKLVKSLQLEKQQLSENLLNKEKIYTAKENLYEQIVNHINEGLAIVQGDKLKFVNKPVLKLLKSTKSELEGGNFSELIHPDQRGQVIQKISNVINGSLQEFSTDIEIITKSSQIINARIFVQQILSTNSQVSLMVKFEDTVEINEKQLEITSLKDTIHLLDNHSEEGIFLLKCPDKKIQSVFSWIIEDTNKAAGAMLNKDIEEFKGLALNKFLIPDYDYQLPEEIDTSYFEDYEILILNFKKYFQCKIYGSTKNRIVCKFQDIHENVLVKKELTRNLQRNELITEILSIYSLNEPYDNRFLKVFERVGYQFKPKRIAILHKTINAKQAKVYCQWTENEDDLFGDEFMLSYQRVPSWQKMLNERKMILGYSFKYLPEDIQTFLTSIKLNNAYVFPIWVEDELYGSILFENQKDIEWDNTEINYLKMVSALLSSLTSHKINEEKILLAKEQAEESDRLKSSFLANMSHDIRIPMTSIIGFSDLLVDEDLTIGEREEFIELISKSGQDLLSLVDNIVDMSKIETGQLKLQLDKCSLPHLFKDLFSFHIENTKITGQDDLDLVLDFPENYKEIPFETDVFRLKQIFDNLIENAIKFTDKGEVRFGISNVWNKTIEFYVHDTGIGIAEETQHIIFKRFGKIDRSYTKEYNGTGLGLSICKSILELMQGEIRVISYPSKGSTFYFTHPLMVEISDSLVQKNTKEKAKPNYNWKHKTILIVEDVEQNYKFLEFLLEPTNAIIIWAQNGKEAVDYIKSGSVADIILMDIRLPVMNGIDATREIKKISSVPIIAQTAYTLGNEKELAIQAGCIDYVSKPINSEKLLQIMNDNMK